MGFWGFGVREDYPANTKFMVTQKAKSEEKEKIKHYQITLEIPQEFKVI